MRLLYPFLIIGVVLVTWFAVKLWTDRQTVEQLHDIDKWRSMDTEDRLKAHTDFSAQLVHKDALRTQAALTFVIAVVAIFTLLLAWIQDTVHSNSTEIARACTADVTFRDLLDARLESQIRTQQQARDDLADSMGSGSGFDADSEQFLALPTSVQAFVKLLAQQSRRAQQERLDEMDNTLSELRAERTAVREFNARQNCP